MLKYTAQPQQHMNMVIRVKAKKKKSLFQQVTLSNSGLAGFDPASNFRLSSKIWGLFNQMFAMYIELPQQKILQCT